MLRFLRKYSSSVGIKILYGFLALLFIIWGVGAVGGERVDVVARVHDETITRRQLDMATADLQRRYEEMLRGQFSAEMARAFDVRGRALDQLINQALVREEADRLGIEVSTGEVDETIMALPRYQVNGQFDASLLEQDLSIRKDRGEFESEVRESLLGQRIQSLVVDGVQIGDGELEDRYRLDHEQISLAFVRTTAADFAKGAELSDDDLRAYLAAHEDRYRAPTTVRARYVAYRGADFASQVQVTDGEVAEYYELHKEDAYAVPEQIRARHILVKVAPDADDDARGAARKKAEELLGQVKAGADFAGLAKQHSDDARSAAQGGDLGLFARGHMTPAFDEAAFALEAGAVSEVVETPLGFHVIKVEEHQNASVKPLDAVRDEILATMRREHAFTLARKQADTDRRAIARGTPFAEALRGRTVAETPPFAAGADVPDVGRVKDFTEVALALGTNEVSDLIETDDAIYLLTPFDRVEAHTPPLEEVRARVEADARRDRGETAAKEAAEKLLARAREIGLAQAAAESHATVEETGPFDRQAATLPKIGAVADLRADAFGLDPGAPLAPKVYVAGGDAIVAAVVARTPAEMSGFASATDALRNTMLQEKRAAVLKAYMDYLKERANREGALEIYAAKLQQRG